MNVINIQASKLSKTEFEKLSRFIHDRCGIRITEAKKTMLESRLKKRLHKLCIDNFSEYCDFLFSKEGERDELIHMIDVVTTNKTEFFREDKQFDYLTKIALPNVLSQKSKIDRKIKVWSAGCSTGEEAYTLGMVLSEYSENYENIYYSILATDISTHVLDIARKAVYPIERVSNIPYELKKKYLLKSKDSAKQLVRIKPDIRNRVSFRRLNFMDRDFGIKEKIEIIFCRNVIIYFDKKIQEELVGKLCNIIPAGGYLFLGHSETVFAMNLPLIQVAPSTYQKI